jgi:hypothetical protein
MPIQLLNEETVVLRGNLRTWWDLAAVIYVIVKDRLLDGLVRLQLIPILDDPCRQANSIFPTSPDTYRVGRW